MKLPEYTKINNYAIELEKSKQPSFRLIYNLELVNKIGDVEDLHKNKPS